MSAFLASHNFGKYPKITEVRNKGKVFPLFPYNILKRKMKERCMLREAQGVLYVNV